MPSLMEKLFQKQMYANQEKLLVCAERGMRRVNTLTILSETIPVKLSYLLSQITRIVAVLCNL